MLRNHLGYTCFLDIAIIQNLGGSLIDFILVVCNVQYGTRNLENISIDSPQFFVGAKQLKFYGYMYTSLEKQHTKN